MLDGRVVLCKMCSLLLPGPLRDEKERRAVLASMSRASRKLMPTQAVGMAPRVEKNCVLRALLFVRNRPGPSAGFLENFLVLALAKRSSGDYSPSRKLRRLRRRGRAMAPCRAARGCLPFALPHVAQPWTQGKFLPTRGGTMQPVKGLSRCSHCEGRLRDSHFCHKCRTAYCSLPCLDAHLEAEHAPAAAVTAGAFCLHDVAELVDRPLS